MNSIHQKIFFAAYKALISNATINQAQLFQRIGKMKRSEVLNRIIGLNGTELDRTD